jgi:hypothetical protein
MNKKKLLIIICIITNQFINTAKAQAPQSFNYQAVARDASGAVLSNQAVSFRISLLQGNTTVTNAYTETHAVTTNYLGLVNFAIGSGTVVSGNFATINWVQGPYFAQIELDANNSGTYVLMSTSQLLSVPYALYSATSGSSIPGPQGPQGPAGNDGAPGTQGAIGPQGPQGLQGLQGQAGATGPTGNQGSIGLTGPAGPQGAIGLTGAQGSQGPAGANGINGADGKTVLNGSSNPTSLIGNNGDFYINTISNIIFGPKASGQWPAIGVSLVGPQGLTGPTGASGPQGPQGPSGGGGFTHYVGEPFGGGVIFYLEKDTNGIEHGLVCHTVPLCQACSWSNITSGWVGIPPSSSNFGTNGLVWSNMIVSQNGHTNSAAKLCLDLVSNGFSDWYLPSIEELYQLWSNRYAVIKGLSTIPGAITINGSTWWSSYEYNSASAYYMSFLLGASVHVGTINKSTSTLSVRAIRAF